MGGLHRPKTRSVLEELQKFVIEQASCRLELAVVLNKDQMYVLADELLLAGETAGIDDVARVDLRYALQNRTVEWFLHRSKLWGFTLVYKGDRA